MDYSKFSMYKIMSFVMRWFDLFTFKNKITKMYFNVRYCAMSFVYIKSDPRVSGNLESFLVPSVFHQIDKV